MDIIGPIPMSECGNRSLLVIIDLFTKCLEAIPLEHKSSMVVATAFLEHFITCFGCPRVILTDAGSKFVSALTNDILYLLNIDHRLSTSFIHHSVGNVKKFNRSLLTMLKTHMSFKGQFVWGQHVNKV